MKPGDIWIAHIPELGTHEQSGTRPVIIIAQVAKTVATVIPCTSNSLALRFPFTCRVSPTRRNGLTNESVALVFHMRVLDVSYLGKKIGTLDRKVLAKIRIQARKLIG